MFGTLWGYLRLHGCFCELQPAVASGVGVYIWFKALFRATPCKCVAGKHLVHSCIASHSISTISAPYAALWRRALLLHYNYIQALL